MEIELNPIPTDRVHFIDKPAAGHAVDQPVSRETPSRCGPIQFGHAMGSAAAQVSESAAKR